MDLYLKMVVPKGSTQEGFDKRCTTSWLAKQTDKTKQIDWVTPYGESMLCYFYRVVIV